MCQTCPLRVSCLTEKAEQRFIRRSKNEAARERNIVLCHTDEGRAALKRRKRVVEPPFGQLKRYGGLGKLNCRTTSRVQVKASVAAIGWNLKKLLKTLEEDQNNPIWRLLRGISSQFRGLRRSQKLENIRRHHIWLEPA